MMNITHRNQFPELLKQLGLVGEAVEVGVAEAYNSWNILDNWPGRLTLVDPWRLLDAPGFSGHGEDTNAGQEARYQRIVRVAQKYGERCKVMRATSEEAAPRFADGSLDFCYIDADHSYEGICSDLSLWAPKVKPGGILAGHDYLEGIHNGQPYGVKQAVTQFAAHYNFTVNVTAETDWPSWFVRI